MPSNWVFRVGIWILRMPHKKHGRTHAIKIAHKIKSHPTIAQAKHNKRFKSTPLQNRLKWSHGYYCNNWNRRDCIDGFRLFFFHHCRGFVTVVFCSELDEHIAKNGPAGLFKLNADGELAFDLMRSRRLRADNEGPYPPKPIHCVLIDRQTKWPQYVLITSEALTKKNRK